jgi:glycosyltransferase involved in cell wall biosynthesis
MSESTPGASPTNESSSALGGRKPLTVRTGSGYGIDFTIDLGQRNARFRRGPLAPQRRFLRWGDAVSWIPSPGSDVIHSFNVVPLTRKPHVITFEDYLPRTPEDRRVAWVERFLQPRLLRENCVALFALSEYALRQCRHQNRDFDRLAELEDKVEVLYPAAKLRAERPKQASDVLRLVFVGTDYVQKGFLALARAHRALREAGVPVETTVVSTLQWAADNYIRPKSEATVREAERGLREEGLRCLGGLPNTQVLDLIDRSTFLVLPTFHDTFGYVAVEALAGATPAIVTGTCALPEVVEDGVSGYVLPFENDPVVGKWVWTYRTTEPGYEEAYHATLDRLAADLTERLSAFWESREDYETLSAGALAKARARFGIERARGTLEGVYETCREYRSGGARQARVGET